MQSSDSNEDLYTFGQYMLGFSILSIFIIWILSIVYWQSKMQIIIEKLKIVLGRINSEKIGLQWFIRKNFYSTYLQINIDKFLYIKEYQEYLDYSQFNSSYEAQDHLFSHKDLQYTETETSFNETEDQSKEEQQNIEDYQFDEEEKQESEIQNIKSKLHNPDLEKNQSQESQKSIKKVNNLSGSGISDQPSLEGHISVLKQPLKFHNKSMISYNYIANQQASSDQNQSKILSNQSLKLNQLSQKDLKYIELNREEELQLSNKIFVQVQQQKVSSQSEIQSALKQSKQDRQKPNKKRINNLFQQKDDIKDPKIIKFL